MRQQARSVAVDDKSDFGHDRDLAVLATTTAEWDAMLAGLVGVLKDAAATNGLTVDSPLLGRADFERLEMQSIKIDSLAEHLATLRTALAPQSAVSA